MPRLVCKLHLIMKHSTTPRVPSKGCQRASV